MKVKVLTDSPIAVHSPDHLDAASGGSGNDNSINPIFNEKLASYFGRKISVLDVGCAGGGFVRSLLDQGHFAVGLEGSDYCLQRKKFEWATIPDNLFTCDATKPFTVYDSDVPPILSFAPMDPEPLKFDLITFWEVMEHFSEEELPQVINNVLEHLTPNGVWLMSVSVQHDRHFHRCVQKRDWWLHKFDVYSLKNDESFLAHFGDDWVRGPKPTPWAITAGDSFHLAMRLKPKE